VGELEITRRVRAIRLALPEVTERPSHGAPAFFVGRQFVMLWPAGHHEVVRPHLWCAASYGAQENLIASDPEQFFRPKYVGSRGWIGTWLDGDCDWDEIAELCIDAYRVIAPVRLNRLLDDPAPS
jgi:hypothetical protein